MIDLSAIRGAAIKLAITAIQVDGTGPRAIIAITMRRDIPDAVDEAISDEEMMREIMDIGTNEGITASMVASHAIEMAKMWATGSAETIADDAHARLPKPEAFITIPSNGFCIPAGPVTRAHLVKLLRDNSETPTKIRFLADMLE